ncbi:MAG: murein L,D-transpeptidase catalytic domain-containing protein [Ferruginibacter sp.]
MKFASRIFVLSIVLLFTISAFGYIFWYRPKFNSTFNFNPNRFKDKSEIIQRLKQKALLVKGFVNEHAYNETHCFLVDMRLPSGKNRFFVYNLIKDSVEIAGLVTHGSGSDNGKEDLIFSNAKNSNCTSLGKYKIGNSYTGNFGLAYKLYGLDNTNSNAFDRFVVLHSHACVPNDEVSPLPICASLGCPTVSPAFLNKLKSYLDESGQPMLLWIYY